MGLEDGCYLPDAGSYDHYYSAPLPSRKPTCKAPDPISPLPKQSSIPLRTYSNLTICSGTSSTATASTMLVLPSDESVSQNRKSRTRSLLFEKPLSMRRKLCLALTSHSGRILLCGRDSCSLSSSMLASNSRDRERSTSIRPRFTKRSGRVKIQSI